MLEKILCIDDDPIALMVLSICIKNAEVAKEIIKKTSAEDALQYLSEIKNIEEVPELIFLDLNMPVMDGWGFLSELKKQYPSFINKTKIIVLSSSVDPFDKENSETDEWVSRFVAKPIRVEILKEIVAN